MSGPLLEKQFDTVIKSFRNRGNKSSKIDLELSDDKNDQISSPDAKKAKFELNSSEEHRLRVENSPTVERFAQEYFKKNVPVIIDGQMSHWPAMKKWG